MADFPIQKDFEKNDKFFVSFDKKGNAKVTETKPSGKFFEGDMKNPIYLFSDNMILPVKGMNIPLFGGVFGVLEKEEILHFSEDGFVKKTLKNKLLTARNAQVTKQEKVIGVIQTNENCIILLTSNKGKKLQFETNEVSSTDRGAKGVIAAKLDKDERIVSVEIIPKRETNIPYGRNKKMK